MRNGKSSSSRKQTTFLFAILASLVMFVAIAPGGPMGFLQGIVDNKDPGSIAILASLIGVLFVVLHINGALPDKDEVECPSHRSRAGCRSGGARAS